MSKRVIKGWVPADTDIDDSFTWQKVWYSKGHIGLENSELCFDVENVFMTQDNVPGLELSGNAKEVTITIEYDD